MTAVRQTSPFPAAGSLLRDRYRLIREIGRGGYSVVYAARDDQLGSDVAVKLLVPPPATADIARERMRREALAVRGLSHPNVVAVYDFLEEGHWSFIVMERIEGDDLAARTKRHRLSVEEVVRLGREMASALDAAHARGILHRDVKPQNVVLDADGTAHLADFGSARLEGQTMTRTGGIVGTLQYTAPELLVGDRADARADIYALGLSLYFALTGGSLPPGTSAQSPPAPAADGHHPRDRQPEVPAWLDRVVARATSADSAHRFATARALDDALAARDTPGGQPPALGRCVICAAPEPFGLSICPACGGAPHGTGDTLVFVQPESGSAEKRHIAQLFDRLLAGRAHGEARKLAAGGHRALIRVPAAAAARAVRELSRQGVPARTADAGLTWTSVPLPFYALLGLTIAVGVLAGLRAAPTLVWTSPLVALLLLLAAQYKLQQPVIATPKRRAVFSPNTERILVETFADLPDGTARSLLASLVRAGEGAFRALGAAADSPVPPEDVEVLLRRAAEAARDLAVLDASLRSFEVYADDGGHVGCGVLDSVMDAERLRDRLVHEFLKGVTVLHRICADATAARDTRTALSELITAIENQAVTQRAARKEIEAVLR